MRNRQSSRHLVQMLRVGVGVSLRPPGVSMSSLGLGLLAVLLLFQPYLLGGARPSHHTSRVARVCVFLPWSTTSTLGPETSRQKGDVHKAKTTREHDWTLQDLSGPRRRTESSSIREMLFTAPTGEQREGAWPIRDHGAVPAAPDCNKGLIISWLLSVGFRLWGERRFHVLLSCHTLTASPACGTASSWRPRPHGGGSQCRTIVWWNRGVSWFWPGPARTCSLHLFCCWEHLPSSFSSS